MPAEAYAAAKQEVLKRQLAFLETRAPGVSGHVVATDLFTPLTVTRFTGHLNGAIYGSPAKLRDGRTHCRNLFVCGTDQGFLGIIGSMLSGISSVTDGAEAEGAGVEIVSVGAAAAAEGVEDGVRPGTAASSRAPTRGCWAITEGMPSAFMAIRGRLPGVAV